MRVRYLVHVVLIPALLAAVVLAVNWRWYSGPLLEVGDEAAYALQVERAKRFRELVGPYSRFDFNHPGPVTSYYYAATEPMLAAVPTPMGRHHVAQLLLNFAFLAMALHAVYVMSPRKSDTALLAAALLFVLTRSRLDPDFFSKTWPPYLLIFPTVTLLTSLAGVSLGRLGLVLPAVLASIYMVHNHVAAVPLALPLWVAAAASGLVSRRRTGTGTTAAERVSLWAALVCVVAASAPPLIDEWRYEPGNLARLAAFFAAHPGPSHGWHEAVPYVAGFFSRPFAPLPAHQRVMAGLMLAATLSLAGTPFHRRLLALAWLSVALLIVGATRIVGPLSDHVMLFTVAVVTVAGFLALVGLRLSRAVVAWPLLLVTAFTAVEAGRVRGENTAPAAADRLLQAVAPQPGHAYELAWEEEGRHHEQWAMAASLAIVLTRRGSVVCTPPAWWVMFGRDLSSCPAGAERLALYATPHRPSPVRDREESVGGTTVEFGPMRPLALPVTLDTSSAFDYFRGWRGSGLGPRAIDGSRATVVVPLGELPRGGAGARVVVSVRGFLGPGAAIDVGLNDHPLGTLAGNGQVEHAWPLPATALVSGENRVVFARKANHGDFLLERLTVALEAERR